MTNTPQPIALVIVRWGPSDSYPPGIRVWREDGSEEQFIPWKELKIELDRQLLPQLFADARDYHFETRDYFGKKDWLVQIFNEHGESYCDVWFGGNPDLGWDFDGFVRVGDANDAPHVWQAYRRYSDGTYRRVLSRCATLDEMTRRRPASGI